MKYYMAPMEGLTGYIYRNAYQKYFHDIDRYFTPFITNKKLDFKVKKDIDPEHNQGMEVVPQILTNQPDVFDPRTYLSVARTEVKKMVEHKIKDVLGSANTL